MNVNRRRINTAGLALLASGVCPPLYAQSDFPTRAMRWIVPFAPGAGTDTVARIVAQKVSEEWGLQLVVDNRSGGGGSIGLGMAANAPADGYI